MAQKPTQGFLPFAQDEYRPIVPFKAQLLKWIGSKQRFAHEIASFFPLDMRRYFEPFLGSGAVLGTLAPDNAIASDAFKPLMEIWQTLHDNPSLLQKWYAGRRESMMKGDKVAEYERIKASYNAAPNGADLLFLCRSCYGGVVRFRKADGYMSTVHPGEAYFCLFPGEARGSLPMGRRGSPFSGEGKGR